MPRGALDLPAMAGGTIRCLALSLFLRKRLAAMTSIVGAIIRLAEMLILEPESPASLTVAIAAVLIEVEVPAGMRMAAPKT